MRWAGIRFCAAMVSAVGGTLTGCRGGTPASITFTTLGGLETEAVAFREIFADFTTKTGVSVEMELLPDVNLYESAIKTRFAANNPPDIFYFFAGPNEYITLNAATNLVEMSGEAYVGDLTGAMRAFYTADGKIYGIPWGSYNAMGVLYNRHVFDRLGIEVPKNWAAFLAACERIKQAGTTPIFEAVRTGWPVQIFSLAGFQTFVLPTIGGMDGVEKLRENRLRIADIPAVRDVFVRQFSLKNSGYYNKNLLAGTYEMQQEELARGTAAMAFQADWMLPEIAHRFPDAVDSIGFFPLPSDTDEGVASLYPPKQILVSRKGRNVRTALSLARHMTKPESLNAWYLRNPGIPVYTSATSALFAGQRDIDRYVRANRGVIQIQLLTSATYVPGYDEICREFLLSGDIDRAVRQMDERYREDGRRKGLPGF